MKCSYRSRSVVAFVRLRTFARLQHLANVLRRTNATTDRERYEHFISDAPHHIDSGIPSLRGCSYVEKNELVGSLIVVGAGQLDRVAGVPQIQEPDAFDHASVGDVEARDDSPGQHGNIAERLEDGIAAEHLAGYRASLDLSGPVRNAQGAGD